MRQLLDVCLTFLPVRICNHLVPEGVERLEGEDRYATANKIVEWELDKNMTIDNAAVATGQDFPDALAASGVQGSL